MIFFTVGETSQRIIFHYLKIPRKTLKKTLKNHENKFLSAKPQKSSTNKKPNQKIIKI